MIFLRRFTTAFLILAVCVLASCEKHDGVYYFKSKCIAELAGVSYIDQQPFTPSPDAIITPELYLTQNSAEFCTLLSAQRGGTAVHSAEIQFYFDSEDDFLCNQFDIRKVDITQSNQQLTGSEYIRYCREHSISYATVDNEIVSSGIFKITSYDKEKGTYSGMFRLSSQQGVLDGKFWIY